MDYRRHPLILAAVFWLCLAGGSLVAAGKTGDGAGGGSVMWIQRASGKALGLPCDVAVDRRGVAFLLDGASRSILLFSSQGVFMREIQGRDAWRDPLALTVAPDGAILLADGETGRAVEMDLSGKVRHEYTAGKGTRITGVAVYGDSVYCVDNRNDRVVIFKRRGGKTGSWGRRGEGPGEFHAPFRVAADAGGRIFVTDVMNARVQWFSAFGRHLGTLKRFGAGAGKFLRPTGISLDSRGRIWICDSYSGLVQMFGEDGQPAGILEAGGDPHVFLDPTGVAEGAGGIWVADQRDGRAALFRKTAREVYSR